VTPEAKCHFKRRKYTEVSMYIRRMFCGAAGHAYSWTDTAAAYLVSGDTNLMVIIPSLLFFISVGC
jgi:hypothetical protein